jgi:phthalate 4,5-cis-dihydrodiol dehydrogenase
VNPVALGVVGLGRGFMLTLPALERNSDIRLAAGFDVRKDASTLFASRFGTPLYNSAEEIYASHDIEAVYIATPHELHAGQAVAALQSGKHVLVEKPMAVSVADCARMERAARQAGRVMMVGPSHAFDRPIERAAELIMSGRFGSVKFATLLNYTDFMFRPRRPEELNSELAGGVVFSQAAHQIDVARRLVGPRVTSVRAVVGSWDPTRTGNGAYSALLSFDGGAAASLTYSGYAHFDSDELVGWIGELGQPKNPHDYGAARRAASARSEAEERAAKLMRGFGGHALPMDLPAPPPHHEHFGFVLVSCERADLRVLPTGIKIYGDENATFEPIDPPVQPRAEVLQEFVRAVRGQGSSWQSPRWGLETVACCAAMEESARRNSDVTPDQIISGYGDTMHDQN